MTRQFGSGEFIAPGKNSPGANFPRSPKALRILTLSSGITTTRDDVLTVLNPESALGKMDLPGYDQEIIMMAARTSRFAFALVLSSLASLLALGSGCSTLVGTVKPVDEKAENYGTLDLSRQDPSTWEKLDPARVSGEEKTSAENSSEIPDAVYQSRKTAATISLNSACRKDDPTELSLEDLTQQLVMGMSDVTLNEKKDLEVASSHALQTTLRGSLSGREVMLRTVVLRRGECVYDFVFLSPPRKFATHEKDFDSFVQSLRVK